VTIFEILVTAIWITSFLLVWWFAFWVSPDAEHESDERGWYAAPVGWFDAAGDGEFAVALRSCVLRGREAYLYAGAGIMRDSDPELERRETELKKQALLRALGA
jgi:isochorismate synthase EntC